MTFKIIQIKLCNVIDIIIENLVNYYSKNKTNNNLEPIFSINDSYVQCSHAEGTNRALVIEGFAPNAIFLLRRYIRRPFVDLFRLLGIYHDFLEILLLATARTKIREAYASKKKP